MEATMVDNVELLRGGYDAFASRDVDAVLARFAPDIEFVVPGPRRVAGTYAGHAGVGEFFGKVAASYERLEVRPDEFVPLDDERVLVLGHHVGDGAAGRFDAPFAHVWRIRGGRAVSFAEYAHTEALAAAVGA